MVPTGMLARPATRVQLDVVDDRADGDVGETRNAQDDHGDGGAGRKEKDTHGALLGFVAELAHDTRVERHVAKRNAADDGNRAQA